MNRSFKFASVAVIGLGLASAGAMAGEGMQIGISADKNANAQGTQSNAVVQTTTPKTGSSAVTPNTTTTQTTTPGTTAQGSTSGTMSGTASGMPSGDRPVGLTRVDPSDLTTGFRTSKVVGSSVVNEAKETVGTIDDLIVTPNERVPYAVLSVGGFLGMGERLVVVPTSQLRMREEEVILPGATKESLKNLPEFKYRS